MKFLRPLVPLNLLVILSAIGVAYSPRLVAQLPSFDAASVKLNKSGDLGMAMRTQPGGRFVGTNVPLRFLIIRAFNLSPFQSGLIVGIPVWVNAERFDIETRATENNPTREQMNLMLQALLADRFKLKVHHDTHYAPVYALVLQKPGKMGPQLRRHSDESPCVSFVPPTAGSMPELPKAVAGGFPETCGGFSGLEASSPGSLRMGGRDLTMDAIANNLTRNADGVNRPVVDETGLIGTFDFVIEWTPRLPPTPDFQVDTSGPTYVEALREQLGLKLKPKVGAIDVLVIDHIEEPSPN